MYFVSDETKTSIYGHIYLNGHTYSSDTNTGFICCPYSNTIKNDQTIILSTSDYSFNSLATFTHMSEIYSLTCDLYIEREQLLNKIIASLLISPTIYLHNKKIKSIGNHLKLIIETVNSEHISSTQMINNFIYIQNEELIHHFNISDHLRTIHFTFTCDVYNQSKNEHQYMLDRTLQMKKYWKILYNDDFYY
jgi:hypothetical protein